MKKILSYFLKNTIILGMVLFPISSYAFSLHVPNNVTNLLPKKSIFGVLVLGEEFDSGTTFQNIDPNADFENDTQFQKPQMMQTPSSPTEPFFDDMQNEENTKQQEENNKRQLEDMKRGAQQMSMGLKNFEFMLKRLQQEKIEIPKEIQEKLSQAKKLIETIKSTQSTAEFQGIGGDELQEIFSELEEFRMNFAENELRVRDVKKMTRGMENGFKGFEKQLTKLEKQKIAIPEKTKETLNRMKIIFASLKTAKNWDEMEAAGVEELQELMQDLDENRQEIEYLSRWPETLKQVDRELKRLTQELKRTKTISDKLLKKEIDISGIYAEFESGIASLKDARERAVNSVKEKDIESAIDILENEFFGAMSDVWENHRIIMTMNDLGRFSSEMKRGISDAQRQIRELKRKKISTSELEVILAQAKGKGDEIAKLMKAKPLDLDAVLSGLQELENFREWFEDTVAELRGDQETLPWEEGPKVFKERPELPSEWEKVIPKKSSENFAPILDTTSIAPESVTSEIIALPSTNITTSP